MWKKSSEGEVTSPRENQRYYIPLPMQIELRMGLFRKVTVPARPVDLSHGGAACHVRPNAAFEVGKRYRLFVDNVAGFVEIRNMEPVEDGLLRIGVSFVQLELETQERIVDALEQAKFESSRIDFGERIAEVG